MIESEFIRRFNETMQLRGKTANASQESRAWQEIGKGQSEGFVSDALWHLERSQGANFATAIAEARQHAMERASARHVKGDANACQFCGGTGYVLLPRVYHPGQYRVPDSVECKSIPRVPGLKMALQHKTCAQAACDCTCRGGAVFPDALVTTWRERKQHLEWANRYETLAEWTIREAMFILREMMPQEEIEGAVFPGSWARITGMPVFRTETPL